MNSYTKNGTFNHNENSSSSLPLRGTYHQTGRVVVGYHLILTGYGHWLANDPRGSGSVKVREDHLKDLGEVHHGRKPIQPSRQEIKSFYKEANPRLKFKPLWFEETLRQRIGDIFGIVIRERRYTVWQCAILTNHVHLCIRKHRDSAETMGMSLVNRTREAASTWEGITRNHPLWSQRIYKVYLYSPEEVRRILRYIQQNPIKEGLGKQIWDFVQPYDGFPYTDPSSR